MMKPRSAGSPSRGGGESGPPAAPSAAAGPRTWVKWVVTILIIFHFMAILSTVVSASAPPTFMASPLAVEINAPFRPYLFATFLQNPYRFYAPNPGPIAQIWYRCEYDDGTVQWSVMPDRDEFYLRMSYQRYLSLTMLLEGNVGMPTPTGYREPTDLARICVASYVRHIGQIESKPDNPVKFVSLFMILHDLLTPQMVRDGYSPTDYRLYHILDAGDYQAATGDRIVSPRSLIDEVVWEVGLPARYDVYKQTDRRHFLTWLLEADIYPLLAKNPSLDGKQAIRKLGLPPPIIAFYDRHPDLLEPRPLVETRHGLRLDRADWDQLFQTIMKYSETKEG